MGRGFASPARTTDRISSLDEIVSMRPRTTPLAFAQMSRSGSAQVMGVESCAPLPSGARTAGMIGIVATL